MARRGSAPSSVSANGIAVYSARSADKSTEQTPLMAVLLAQANMLFASKMVLHALTCAHSRCHLSIA